MRVLLLAFLLFFVLVAPVKATRNLIISSEKSSLNANEEMLINASASGFASSEAIFIKGAFFKEGETNYFGLTKFGDGWIKNNESSENQLKVSLDSWDGRLVIKSDYNDTGFKGSGGYKLKVGFYYTTSGGNISSVNWSSNILDINLTAPTPTPVVSPTSAPTPVASPSPTATTLKTLTPIVTPISQKSPSPIPTETPVETVEPSPEVLGIQDEVLTPSPTATPVVLDTKKISRSAILAYILTASGVLIIVLSIYLGLKASN